MARTRCWKNRVLRFFGKNFRVGWRVSFYFFDNFFSFGMFDAEDNFFFFKLWMAVYPSNMAAFGLKLWENAFQTIPNISFSTSKKKWQKFSIKKSSTLFFDRKSTNCLFLRSYGFLDLIGRCASKSYPQSFDFQLSTTFGGGVKEIVSTFAPDFRSKMTSRLLFFRRRKMKCRESSETRFPKVSRRSEPCSRGKRPFEN